MGQKCRRPHLGDILKASGHQVKRSMEQIFTLAFLQNNILFSGSNIKFAKSIVEDTFPVIIEKVVEL